jgi:hypothetical protein
MFHECRQKQIMEVLGWLACKKGVEVFKLLRWHERKLALGWGSWLTLYPSSG